MAKKKTPEQVALAAAARKPERRRFMSRRMAWARGDKWAFFTNYHGFSFSTGSPKKKFHGGDVPESQFTMSVDWRPFKVVVFWDLKRILWVGDWEWKKAFRVG